MDYIKYIRKYMGHRPVILNGTSVLILDQTNKVLLQKRTYPDKIWGLPGGIMAVSYTHLLFSFQIISFLIRSF